MPVGRIEVVGSRKDGSTERNSVSVETRDAEGRICGIDYRLLGEHIYWMLERNDKVVVERNVNSD